MKIIYDALTCKFCGSRHIVKFGKFRGVQRFWCKVCKRKFVDNDALPSMRTPVRQVSAILSMWYGGMPLKEIKRHSEQQFNTFPSRSTLYRWLTRFTKIAVKEAKKHTPQVGDVWIADETVLKISGKNFWFWDIIDAKTRFLLASHMSRARTIRDARTLVDKAATTAKKTPKVIITDKLLAYLDGIELAFGADTKHIQSKPFEDKDSTNIIERFHSTLKTRTKIVRGFKDLHTAKLLLDGWLVHYNFFRTHETLGDHTPAKAAGIEFSFRDWIAVVESQSPTKRGAKQGKDIPTREVLTLHHPKAKPSISVTREPIKLSSRKLFVSRRETRKPREIDLGMGIVRSKGRQHIKL